MREIKKGGGRPSGGYRLPDGSRVPSVTTVLGRFKESGGLIQWAYKRGLDSKDLYEERDRAGSIGSVVHDMAEVMIHGGDPYEAMGKLCLKANLPDDDWAKVETGFSGFYSWFTNASVDITETEMAYASEEMGFAGTLDAVGYVGDELCILDWKTSNAIYTDYLTQVAAYALLWEEAHPEVVGEFGQSQGIEGFHICRFSKKSGGFSHNYYPNLDPAKEMFLTLLKAYQLDKKLKELL